MFLECRRLMAYQELHISNSQAIQESFRNYSIFATLRYMITWGFGMDLGASEGLKVIDAGECVWMLRPQRCFLVSQCLSAHGFSLFILSLSEKNQSKVIGTGKCLWMLWPQCSFLVSQCSLVHGFSLFILSLPGKN